MALAQKLLLKNQYPLVRLRWINAINKVIMQNYVAKVKLRLEQLKKLARERALKGRTKMVRKMLSKTADQVSDLRIKQQLPPIRHDLAALHLHLADSPTQKQLHFCGATASSAAYMSERRMQRVTGSKTLLVISNVEKVIEAGDPPSFHIRRSSQPLPLSRGASANSHKPRHPLPVSPHSVCSRPSSPGSPTMASVRSPSPVMLSPNKQSSHSLVATRLSPLNVDNATKHHSVVLSTA